MRRRPAQPCFTTPSTTCPGPHCRISATAAFRRSTIAEAPIGFRFAVEARNTHLGPWMRGILKRTDKNAWHLLDERGNKCPGTLFHSGKDGVVAEFDMFYRKPTPAAIAAGKAAAADTTNGAVAAAGPAAAPAAKPAAMPAGAAKPAAARAAATARPTATRTTASRVTFAADTAKPASKPKPTTAAAEATTKAACKACRGWKRPHTCGKARAKPGPKPRQREGECWACLGEHVAHTCGMHGRPEARVPAAPRCPTP